MATTHVVRLKLFRLKTEGVTHASPPATQGKEKHDCSTLAECDFCIKHGFKNSLQPSAYTPELH